jgi:hypothetical protein
MIAATITTMALLGASLLPTQISHHKLSPSTMPSQPFTAITQARDMGGYWQTEPGIAPACRLMLTFRPATIAKVEAWEVVARECPDGPLSKAAFWHIDQGKVQVLNADGHAIALFGLTQVDRIAPAKPEEGLYPMIRGFIS